MATKKISELDAGTTLAGIEEFPGVQSGETVKFTADQIKDRVLAAGGTFDVAVQFPAGSVSAPSIAINESGSGFYEIDGTTKALAIDGLQIAFWQNGSSSPRYVVSKDTTSPLTVAAIVQAYQIVGTQAGSSASLNARFSANGFARTHYFYKSRNAAPGGNTIVASGDNCGIILWTADDGTTTGVNLAQIAALVDGTPGTGDMPGRLAFYTVSDGGTTLTERLRIDNAGAMIHRNNGQQIVDANSHLQLRSYTVGGLPSAATAGQLIYVSNETGGAVVAFSDGTNWRRVTDRAIVA